MKLELNETEVQNLLVLLEVYAVKAGGIDAARAAIPIVDRIRANGSKPADDNIENKEAN